MLTDTELPHPYKVTNNGKPRNHTHWLDSPIKGLHIGSRLTKKLNTHRWHVLRFAFSDYPHDESFEAVTAAKTVEPNAIKKLVGKAWCARQIMWPNRQLGILLEVGTSGFYLVAPAAEQHAKGIGNAKTSTPKSLAA